MDQVISAKLKVPIGMYFTQIFRKHPTETVEYELHLFGRLVFYCRRDTFKECIEFRNQWLKENRS